MCIWGDHQDIEVTIPAHLSHTGEARRATVHVDRCLASLIVALNEAGFMTANCCCGHGKDLPEIIMCDGTVIHGNVMSTPSETVP